MRSFSSERYRLVILAKTIAIQSHSDHLLIEGLAANTGMLEWELEKLEVKVRKRKEVIKRKRETEINVSSHSYT